MIWILTLIFLLLDGLFNRWRIVKFGDIKHWVNVAYRVAFGLAMIEIYSPHGWQLVFFAVGGFCGFKLLFDIEMNLLDRKPINSIGTTGFLDILQNKTGIPWIAETWFELVIAAAGVYGYYHTDLM